MANTPYQPWKQLLDQMMINQPQPRPAAEVAQQPIDNRTYWEDPRRIVRYYQAVQARPDVLFNFEGPSQERRYDQDFFWSWKTRLGSAFKFLESANKGKDYWDWEIPQGVPELESLLSGLETPPGAAKEFEVPDALRPRLPTGMPWLNQSYAPGSIAPVGGGTGAPEAAITDWDSLFREAKNVDWERLSQVGLREYYKEKVTPGYTAVEPAIDMPGLEAFPVASLVNAVKQGKLNDYIKEQPYWALPLNILTTANPLFNLYKILIRAAIKETNAAQQEAGVTKEEYAQAPLLDKILGPVSRRQADLMGAATLNPLLMAFFSGSSAVANFPLPQGEDFEALRAGQAGSQKVLLWLDALVGAVEKTSGIIKQIEASIHDPGRYGEVSEILENIPEAYSAGYVNWDLLIPSMKKGEETTKQLYKPAVTAEIPEGYDAGYYQLMQMRRKLMETESADEEIKLLKLLASDLPEDQMKQLYQEEQRLGFTGMLGNLALSMGLDPLNFVGRPSNTYVMSPVIRKLGNARLADAYLGAGNLSEVRFKYAQALRDLPPSQRIELGAINRAVAGLDKEGNLKNYSNVKRGGVLGVFDWLVNETPESKAHYLVQHTVEGVDQYLDTRLTAEEKMSAYRIMTGEETGEGPNLLQSADAQFVAPVVGSAKKEIDDLYGLYQVTHSRAAGPSPADVLQRFADVLEMDVYEMKAKLHSMSAKEADGWLEAMVKTLEDKAGDGDQKSAKILEGIRSDPWINTKKGEGLKTFADLFTGTTAAPFSVEEFGKRMAYIIGQKADIYAGQRFNVRPSPWFIRLTESMKRLQGYVLLGFNPTYLFNNAINNVVTMSWDGTFGFLGARSRKEFLQRFGALPVRLRSGATAAEIGEVGGIQGAGKGEYTLGEMIRRMKKANDNLQKMDDTLRKGEKAAFFANAAQVVEQWSSELAMATTLRKYIANNWVEGKGFRALPPDLAAVLDAVHPGMSRRVIDAVAGGINRKEIERNIERLFNWELPTLDSVLDPKDRDLMANIPGLTDFLNENLAGARTDLERRRVFADAVKMAQENIKAAVERKARAAAEEAAAKVGIEKEAGLVDLFDEVFGSYYDTFQAHMAKMDTEAERISQIDNPELRSLEWQRVFDEADREWQAQQDRFGSAWLGSYEGLGGMYRGECLASLTEMHDVMRNFYQERQRILRAYFDGKGTDAEITWAEAQARLNQAYANMVLVEDGNQTVLDHYYANAYGERLAEKNPDATRQAEYWRESVRDARRQMVLAQLYYRAGSIDLAGGKLGTLRGDVKKGIDAIPRTLPDGTRRSNHDIADDFYRKVYQPLLAEMVNTSNGTTPGHAIPDEWAARNDYARLVDENAKVEEAAPKVEAAQEEAAPEPKRDLSENMRKAPEPVTPMPRVFALSDDDVFNIASDEYGMGILTAEEQMHVWNAVKDGIGTGYNRENLTRTQVESALTARKERLYQQAIKEKAYAAWAKKIKENIYTLENVIKGQGKDRLTYLANEVLGDEKAGPVLEIIDRLIGTAASERGITKDEMYNQFSWARNWSPSGYEPGGWRFLSEDDTRKALLQPTKTMRPADVAMAVSGLRDARLVHPLTQLPNRFAFNLAMQRKPKWVALIDVDGLRAVNDRYSDAAGDGMLRALAYELQRSGLEVYHLSGDEFAVLDDGESATGFIFDLDRVSRRFSERVFEAPGSLNDRLQGGQISYGVGTDVRTAEEALNGSRVISEIYPANNQSSKRYRESTKRRIKGQVPPDLRNAPKRSQVEIELDYAKNLEAWRKKNPHAADYVIGLDEYKPEDQQALVGRLREAINTEPTTGLKSEYALYYGKRFKYYVNVNLADMKWFNDRYGHDVTNIILSSIAERMKGITENAYNTGGDMFYLGTDALEDVNRFQQELNLALESAIINLDGSNKTKVRLIYGRGTTIAGSANSARRFKESLREQGILPERGEIPFGAGTVRTGQGWGLGNTGDWWGGGWESASFEESIKGLTRYLASGRNVVGLGSKADVSTFLHETVHLITPMLGEKDRRTIENWLLAQYSNFQIEPGWYHEGRGVDAKELLSRAFERYTTQGIAPVPAMRSVFEKMKRWMLEIYGQISGIKYKGQEVTYSPEIQAMFDRWMGKEEPGRFDKLSGQPKPPEGGGPEAPAPRAPEAEIQPGISEEPAAAAQPEPQAAAQPEPAAMGRPRARVTKNNQGSIEISFIEGKPSTDVLDRIKQMGYRWNKVARSWYKKNPSAADWELVDSVVRVEDGLPELKAEEKALPLDGKYPTIDEWKGKKSDYWKMLNDAVANGDLGYDDALRLMNGDKVNADKMMNNRYYRVAHTMTLQQYIDAATPYYLNDGIGDMVSVLRERHLTRLEMALKNGEKVYEGWEQDYPNENVLLGYYQAQPAAPTSVLDGTGMDAKAEESAPAMNEEGQGTLFPVEFGLKSEDVKPETFRPQEEGGQGSLFDRGEFKKGIEPKKVQGEGVGKATDLLSSREGVEPGTGPAQLPEVTPAPAPTPEPETTGILSGGRGAVMPTAFESKLFGQRMNKVGLPMGTAMLKLFKRWGIMETIVNFDDFAARIESEGYMPLIIERHGNTISLTHTYMQNGDVMYDPDMEFNIVSWEPISITQQHPFRGQVRLEKYRYNESTGLWDLNANFDKGMGEFVRTWSKNIQEQFTGNNVRVSVMDRINGDYRQISGPPREEPELRQAQLPEPEPKFTPERRQELIAAMRETFLKALSEEGGTWGEETLYRSLNEYGVPGFDGWGVHEVVKMIGSDVVRDVANQVWNDYNNSTPAMGMPDKIPEAPVKTLVTDLVTAMDTLDTPKKFEEYVQRLTGLDMNDEKNLNLAYDALEGAFNVRARKIRSESARASRNTGTLEERITKLAKLEENLLRARRTLAKSDLQQFSTPLTISEAAMWAADIMPEDIVMEPTAGTGNLIDGIRTDWQNTVEVKVNEIDAARRDVLRALGYEPTGIDLMSADWLLENGRLAGPNSNIVISNPPWGAYSTGKYGKPVDPDMNDWSQRFVDLTLRRLAPGGRFVGILPTNWVYTLDRASRTITVKRSAYLKKLEQTYWVRAIIESPPDAYKSRATNVGSLLIVIDKSSSRGTTMERWGENAPKSWNEYSLLVEELQGLGQFRRDANDRRISLESTRAIRERDWNARREPSGPDSSGLVDPHARSGRPEPAPERIGEPFDSGQRGREENGAADVGRSVANAERNAADERAAAARAAARGQPNEDSAVRGADTRGGLERPGRGTETLQAGRDRGLPGSVADVTGDTGAGQAPMVEGQPGEVPGGMGAELSADVQEPGRTEEGAIQDQPETGNASDTRRTGASAREPGRLPEYRANWVESVRTIERAGAFTGYESRARAHLESAGEPINHHPSMVVETKALAGIQAPEFETEYMPTQGVMDAYRRGDLSAEGQLDPIWAAVQQNDKNHMGLLVADDVGVGKSRTAAGFALDRIERGQKRILVVTHNSDNVENLMDGEFRTVIGDRKDIQYVLVSGETMQDVKQGKAPLPTFKQPTIYFINHYQFADFGDALIKLNPETLIVDEVHDFKNLGAKFGAPWIELHKTMNRNGGSYMYLSATPGVDLRDLQYLFGLKLWSVDGFDDWLGVLTGRLSPEELKKIEGARTDLFKYRSRIEGAVKEKFGKPTVFKLQGLQVVGYEMPDGVRVIQTASGFGEIYIGGQYGSIRKVHSGDFQTAILIADELSNVIRGMEYSNASDTSIKNYIRQANETVGNRYQRPAFDEQTNKALGQAGAGVGGDATDLQGGKTKKFKVGSRSAFTSTLPMEHTEQIMREMKIGGSYISRDISRVGVNFEAKELRLTTRQLATHNKRIDLYRRIMKAYEKYGKMNKKQRIDPGVSGDLQADAKRALFDARLAQAIPEIDAALAAGRKIVVSLESVSEVDPEAGGYLRKAIMSINDHAVEKNKDGSYTNPTEIPEAMVVKAELIQAATELGLLESPIDILRRKYGTRIGFITGKESKNARRNTSAAFQADNIDVVVISGAGKTGINLHDITGKRRVHLMVVDYDWSPTSFKQALGRVDRTGQLTSPMVTIYHTGNASEVKFIATIAARMKGLGATSKGAAESTGTSILNDDFDLGSYGSRLAISNTWDQITYEDQLLFLDKYFFLKGEPIFQLPPTALAASKFTKALQTIPLEDANRIWAIYVKNRDALAGINSAVKASAEESFSGAIIRTTRLGNNLRMSEVRNLGGNRFAIVSGVLTPNMNKLSQASSGIVGGGAVGDDGEFQWRKWRTFQDADTGERVSGLMIPPGKIEEIALAFNQRIAVEHRPEFVLRDLKAGDKIPLIGDGMAEWILRLGQSGFKADKIVIDGAKMANKDALMNNGASYDARGMFFFVPEGNLPEFLKRFPIRNEDGGGANTLFQEAPQGMTFAYGADNQRYDFRWRVSELDDLIPSHTDTFDPNPRFMDDTDEGGGEQPRDRSALAYREQVTRIAQNLIPDILLTDSHSLDNGSPIGTSDKKIANGNGRTLGARLARTDYPLKFAELTDELRKRIDAGEYGPNTGYSPDMVDPFLWRELITPVDRKYFAQMAQQGVSMQLTSVEMAYTDASYLDESFVARMEPAADGTLDSALRMKKNEEWLAEYVRKMPAIDASQFLNADGEVTAGGLQRIKQALFALIYKGDAGKRMTKMFIGTILDDMRNVQNAMMASLGAVSQAESLVRSGQRPAELGISDDVIKVVDVYARLKNEGKNVPEYLSQVPLFEEHELSEFQRAMMMDVHQLRNKPARLRDILVLYADSVVNQAPAEQMTLTGVENPRASKLDLWTEASRGVGIESAVENMAEAPAAAAMVEPRAVETPEEPATPAPAQQMEPDMQDVGTTDGLRETPVENGMLETWMSEIEPALRRTERRFGEQASMVQKYKGRTVPPDVRRKLGGWLGGVWNDMADTKLAAVRNAEAARDFALLNYGRRTGLDTLLQMVMPYEFWYTRSALNWAIRAISQPAIATNYMRLVNFYQRQTDREGYPNRLKRKVGIKLPFLPKWTGGTVYVDPLKQIFPFDQMLRPWKDMAETKNMTTKRTESLLSEMLENSEISQEQYNTALQSRKGAVWNRAYAQAGTETSGENEGPLDIPFMMVSPSLPIGWAYNYMTGNKDKIGQLPSTRLVQNVTAALGIGKTPRGVNLEAPIRKAAGLPEVDQYEDYRVDRMLANMAADGEFPTDVILQAMIERKGEAFTEAQRKVSGLGLWQYIGAPLGVDFFPEGEQRQRLIKLEYNKAVKAKLKGDEEALPKFFDAYPEYEARSASFKEPEERLRSFLVSEVWDRYLEMPKIHQEQVRGAFGDTFQDAFLDSETRSYASINLQTLAAWAQTLGSKLPSKVEGTSLPLELAPEDVAKQVETYNKERDQKFPGIFDLMDAYYAQPAGQEYPEELSRYNAWRYGWMAEHKETIPWLIGDKSELYGLPLTIQSMVVQYRADKEKQFPGIDAVQDRYFALDKTLQPSYKKANPELADYWNWRKEYAAIYPQAAGWILSDSTMRNALTGYQAEGVLSNAELAEFSPQLLRALLAVKYSGEVLRAGIEDELYKHWDEWGQPGGDFDAWVRDSVYPSLE